MKIRSANAVSFIYAGISVESGKGADIFCKIEPLGERFVTVVGIDSEVTRGETGDGRHRVTLTIQGSSESNALLSAIHILDIKARNGAGVAPLMIKDQNGLDLVIDPEAFIEKWPTVEWKKEPGENEWSFMCPNPEIFIGGN
jgi:hypothetical protein